MPTASTRAIVALGSNIGDRRGHFDAAIEALNAHEGVQVRRCSRFRETRPVGGPPQDDYLNGAVLIDTELGPHELLGLLMQVEQSRGRRRQIHWGPRSLDLDLLWMDNLVVESDELTVPHPRLKERKFALEPLLDVLPDAVDPHSRRPYADIYLNISDS